jgi:hypothetical protein
MNLDPNCNNPIQSYYYVDDVLSSSMVSPTCLMWNSGTRFTACGEYVIDPGCLVIYITMGRWDSIDPTLTVNQTGTYTVTIFDGCAFGIDSLGSDHYSGTNSLMSVLR